MTKPPEMDPLDVLRGADPVDVDHLPSASLARIRARVREDVMSHEPRPRRSLRPTALLGLAGGAIAAGAVALALLVGGGQLPGPVPGSSGGPGSAMCVEPYSPAALARRDLAFDGTVTAIAGSRVTFTVNHAYRGVDGSSVTLEARGMTGPPLTSAGGPSLVVGQRYLVAGDDAFAWACGYTQPYDPTVAAEWQAALGA